MGARLYHQRYQTWNREPDIASVGARASRVDPADDIDIRTACAAEFTRAELGTLGDRLLAEIEHYLAFFAVVQVLDSRGTSP
jgi:hypothetical protein